MCDLERLPQVCICWSIRKCEEQYKNYIKKNREKISKTFKRYPMRIRLEDDTEIFFMTDEYYATWCKGRTYKFYESDGIYRSDRKIKGE